MRLATKFPIAITAALLITLPAWAAQNIDGSKIVLTRAASFAPVAALRTKVKAVRVFSNDSIEQREKNDKYLNDFAVIFYALNRKHPYSRATKDKDDNKIFIGGGTDANLQNLICTYLEDEFHCCNTLDATRRGYIDAVYALCACAPGLIVSGSWDGTLKLFRIDTSTNPPKLQLYDTFDITRGGHADSVYALCACAPGLIVSGSWDGAMKLCRVDTSTNPPKLQLRDTFDIARGGNTGVVNAFCAPVPGMIVSGAGDGTLKLCRIDTSKNPPKLQLFHALDRTRGGHADVVYALCAPAPGLIASGSLYGTIQLCRIDDTTNPPKLQLCHTLDRTRGGHADTVYALCACAPGLIASGDRDGTIQLYRIDISTNPPALQLFDTLYATRGGRTSAITALCAPAPGLIASGSYDGTMKLYRIDTNPPKLQLCNTFYATRVTGLCAPELGLIASGNYDGTIKLWASTAWLLRNCTKKRYINILN